jgi:hypothetical protein
MTMNTLAPHVDADFARKMAHDVEIRLQNVAFRTGGQAQGNVHVAVVVKVLNLHQNSFPKAALDRRPALVKPIASGSVQAL